MTKVAFISDIHANWDVYADICKRYENTVQVGDFGMGFESANRLVPYLPQNHRFIRGNHDDPAKCAAHPNWIKDGTIEIIGNSKVMFIGGAKSIDKYRRKEGLDWWADEECSYAQWQEFINRYEEEKPDVLVTHDCPQDFAKQFILRAHKPAYPSVTGQALQVMHSIHAPRFWVMGHWHVDLDVTHNGTRFLCSNHTDIYNDGVIEVDL